MEQSRPAAVPISAAPVEAPMPAWVDEPLFVTDIVRAAPPYPAVPVMVTGPGMAVFSFRRRRRRL